VVDDQLGYYLGPQCFEIIDASLPFVQVDAACLDRIVATPGIRRSASA
jgi:hypothetical protein